jgi:hypothetical protein
MASVDGPALVAITAPPGVRGSHQALVTIQVRDGAGNDLNRPFALLVYLSDDSNGVGLTAHPPTDEIHTHRPDGGADLHTRCARRSLEVLTNGSGRYVLSVNDREHRPYYVCAVCPGTGEVQVSAALTPESYGG